MSKILFLNKDLKLSAKSLNDYHIREMPISLVRELSRFLRIHNLDIGYYNIPISFIQRDYLKVSPNSYKYLVEYLEILLEEFKFRFKKDHILKDTLKELKKVTDKDLFLKVSFHNLRIKRPVELPLEYHIKKMKTREIDTFLTCKKYYIEEHLFGEYTNRKKPRWLTNETTKTKIKPTIEISSNF